MSNTFIFESSQDANQSEEKVIYRSKISSFSTFIAIILTLVVLVNHCQCRDTVLLASLSTKTDQILFRMLKQTNYLLKSNRVVNGKDLTCYSIVKNELTSNHPQKPVFLNHSISHKALNNKPFGHAENDAQQEKLYKRLDSILNILNGVCLYYRTTTFISEYCHKEHFRQYDDQYTKFYNQKQKYQDFYLGFFNPLSEARVKLKHSDGTLLPQKSSFKNIHSIPSVSDVFQITKNIELQEDQNGKLVHSTTHLITSETYITKLPVFLEMKCLSQAKKLIFNVVLTVSPFDFVYTRKQDKCEEFISAVELQTSVGYDRQQNLRVYQEFLYGDVEQICTQNWKWQGEGENKHYQDAELKSGSTIYLSYVVLENNQTFVKEELVIVKHVHNYDLIQLQQKVGISFNNKELKKIVPNLKKYPFVQRIAQCQILFDKPLLTAKKYANNIYLGNNLAILDEDLQKERQQSKKLGCVCQLIKQSSTHLIDLKIQAGNPTWLNYYRIYMQTKTFIYLYSHFKDTVFSECFKLDCYRFNENYFPDSLPKSRYTSVRKIAKSNQIYNVTQATKHHIYVLNIHQSGTIRLVTKDSKGNIYFYVMSEGQILKIRQFENGTKQIIKQNKYYENLTKTSSGNLENYIFIHCFLLSNGSKYGAIWKYRDFLFFPRYLLADQQLVSFQYRHGYAYLRILNPQKMKNKQALVILNYQKLIQKHYTVSEHKSQLNEPIFLDKSYSINYTYEGGDFCGPPINKKRTTTVTLKCGKAWFKIQKVHQTAPCSYFVQIQTLLLCQENTKEVVQSDEQLANKTEQDKVSFSGVTCLKEEGVYNKIAPFVYPGKKLLG